MGRGTLGASRRALTHAATHRTTSAAALFALVVLAYLWPVLLGGEVLAPDSMLYELVPWQHAAPPDLASFHNYLLSDPPFVMTPWREAVRELIRSGTPPLWNAHELTGVPLLANPQAGLFTPFSLPLWILPFHWALGLAAALKLFAAALGTYLLARELRLGFFAGLAAGIAFALCSYNVMWLTWETLPAVAAMLPWMLWFVERLFNGGGLGNLSGLALVTAAAVGGGHPGSQVHVLVAAGCYVLLRAAFGGRARSLRPLGLALGGVGLGAALIGVLLIPEMLSSVGTVGTHAREGGHGTLPGLERMPLRTIVTPLLPDWWGRPSAFETPNQPLLGLAVSYQERTYYAGTLALLLAAVGLTNRSALRRQAPFLVLGVLGLASALHAPGVWWLLSHAPPMSLVENQRLHFVFELAVAVLAAFGLQAILERPHERRRQLAVAASGAVVAVVAGLVSGASATDLGRLARHFLAGEDFHRTAFIHLTAAAWLLLFALGLVAGLLALRRWPERRGWIAAAIVLLVAFDMLHFAHGYNPMAPAEKGIPPRTPAIAYLQRHRAEGRFVGVGIALPPDVAIDYGLADVRGYDPPYPTSRYYALWQAGIPEQLEWTPLEVDNFTPAAVQVVSVLGARFVIGSPGDRAPGGRDPAVSALRRVYRGRDATIFVNPRAVPRAFVAPAVELAPNAASTRALLADSRLDPGRAVVVEGDQPGAARLASVHDVHGRAEIVEEGDARVTLHATLDRPGIVVLGDQLLDGWSVTVDGRDATPLRVDAVLRGVAVDAGSHTVRWSYRVPGLRAGAGLSAAAAVLLLALALAPRAVRRRRAARARR